MPTRWVGLGGVAAALKLLLADRPLPMTATVAGGRQERRKHRPFRIGQVASIAQSRAAILSAGGRVHMMSPARLRTPARKPPKNRSALIPKWPLRAHPKHRTAGGDISARRLGGPVGAPVRSTCVADLTRLRPE